MRKCTPREVTSDLSEAIEHVGRGGTGIEGQVSLMLESGSSRRVALCNEGTKLRSAVVCWKHKTGIDRCEGLKYSPPSKVHTHTHTHGHTHRTHTFTHTHTHMEYTHPHTRAECTHTGHTHIPGFGNIFLMQMLQPPAGKRLQSAPLVVGGGQRAYGRAASTVKIQSQKDRHS